MNAKQPEGGITVLVETGKFAGWCVCGREHQMTTKTAVIEPGCLERLDEIMERYGVSGKRCALYDENTYAAAGTKRPRAQQEMVLDPAGLHANEISTARVLAGLEEDVEVVVAVGAGTIHDIARYCAHERGCRFVSCPTAASVDGFCSNVAAMTWHGYKKTLPAVAPELVIADTDVIRNAPIRLAVSGVGDILAKYTALADWRIANLLIGEHFCQTICGIMDEAMETVASRTDGILTGDEGAFAALTYALVMSGIAMQMMGNSRPASGAEHHISHMIEMEAAALDAVSSALHGEKAGVGAMLAAGEYKRLAAMEDIAGCLKPYRPVSEEEVGAVYGRDLAQAIIQENREDCLAGVTPELLAEKWTEIRAVAARLPEEGEIGAVLSRLGAKHTLEDIGIPESKKELLLDWSPWVRNRLTLMRVRRMMELG